MPSYRLISWNVNGIRATLKKGFLDWFQQQDADLVCIQETKAQLDQIPEEVSKIAGYHSYFDSAEKKGYSGVGLFSKSLPLKVYHHLEDDRFNHEGRIVAAEYPEFILFGVYFPNGQSGSDRLQFKLDFYAAFLDHIERLRAQGKRIVVCGDVNTAHQEIDLARPKENVQNSGFLPVERAWMDRLFSLGYIDTFRHFEKGGGHYTYWDQRFRARERNVGWRIDYVIVSPELLPHLQEAFIQPEVQGSDHCPVGVTLQF